MTYRNKFLESSANKSKPNLIEQSSPDMTALIPRTEKNKDYYNKFNEYALKQNYRLKSFINFVDKHEIKESNEMKYQSSYLTNVNDFSIKEATNINNDRVIKFEKKIAEVYNCIEDQKSTIAQPKYQIDKWGRFYEK